MPRPATPILLSANEQEQLEAMMRSPKAENRYVQRAKIVLKCSEGLSNKEIAKHIRIREATVSKWRVRFEREGIAGLHDDLRPGRPPIYDDEAVRTAILAKIDQPPPEGFSCWNGKLLAGAIGISPYKVWAQLGVLGISLQRRRSWCVSTDAQFARKSADVVGLYLSPPENAVVLSVDEKPCIQALERAQGWPKLPDGRALTGYSHEYKRHGTTTLFAALNIATGEVAAGNFKRRRRVEFLDFMDRVVASHPGKELHVILDNLSSHVLKDNHPWKLAHPDVHFHFTPTHASWLNQIEVWFSILSRKALRGASFTSVKQLVQAIETFVKVYNQDASPFEWTKVNVRAKSPEAKYADLFS